jgi:hypothetical protein
MIKNVIEKQKLLLYFLIVPPMAVILCKMFNSLMSDVDSVLSVRLCEKSINQYCELNKVHKIL